MDEKYDNRSESVKALDRIESALIETRDYLESLSKHAARIADSLAKIAARTEEP